MSTALFRQQSRCCCWLRQCYSTAATAPAPTPVRKTDWKRRQEGSNFVDTLSITCYSGHGGPGGVSFHREKFKAKGPPSGGNGGRGGSVYLLASTSVSNLSHLPRTIRAGAGGAGGGKWLAGKRGEDVYIQVPLGTVVRERLPDESEREEQDDEDEEEKSLKELVQLAYEASKVRLAEAEKRDERWKAWKKARTEAEKAGHKSQPFVEEDVIELESDQQAALERMRETLFVMYPGTELDTFTPFLRSEHDLLSSMMVRHELLPVKRRRRRRRTTATEPLDLDLTSTTPIDDAILVAKGGRNGMGNPTFHSTEDRSPKYATRGGPGEVVRLDLELKSAGEVGLVGLPNAGKSTLLRALTSSTPRVASYAFTTLNPHHGTCILYDDGSYSGAAETIEDTLSAPEEFTAESAGALRDRREAQRLTNRVARGRTEVMRFSVTDNPGLVARSADNVGLGHSFLRHIERCSMVVYVVDLAAPNDPVEALKTVRQELKDYAESKGILSLLGKARGVVANKADLFDAENEQASLGARARLAQVKEAVKQIAEEEIEEGLRQADDRMWVVPASAKEQLNMRAVVDRLATTVRQERERASSSIVE